MVRLRRKPVKKKTVRDIDVKGKRVLVRVDYNVPLDAGRILDDSRIRATLPTISYLRGQRAKVILASHLGRPKGRDESLSLRPVAERLGELLGTEVRLAPGVVGPEVEAASKELGDGEVLLLENVRFEAGETKNDDGLAQGYAALCD